MIGLLRVIVRIFGDFAKNAYFVNVCPKINRLQAQSAQSRSFIWHSNVQHVVLFFQLFYHHRRTKAMQQCFENWFLKIPNFASNLITFRKLKMGFSIEIMEIGKRTPQDAIVPFKVQIQFYCSLR